MMVYTFFMMPFPKEKRVAFAHFMDFAICSRIFAFTLLVHPLSIFCSSISYISCSLHLFILFSALLRGVFRCRYTASFQSIFKWFCVCVCFRAIRVFVYPKNILGYYVSLLICTFLCHGATKMLQVFLRPFFSPNIFFVILLLLVVCFGKNSIASGDAESLFTCTC